MNTEFYMKIDTQTEDLQILKMSEYIVKRMTQMDLSYPEINALKNPSYEGLKNDLYILEDSALNQINQFFDLSDNHYDLRKNLSDCDPNQFSELVNNNAMLVATFLSINNTISEFDITRIRLNIS